MSPESQRVALAELCGWRVSEKPTRKYPRTIYSNREGTLHCTVWTDKEVIGGDKFPDYLNDLNAMHEAEKTLGGRDWRYVQELRKFSDGDVVHSYTAAQRAESMLRALGKWVEAK